MNGTFKGSQRTKQIKSARISSCLSGIKSFCQALQSVRHVFLPDWRSHDEDKVIPELEDTRVDIDLT